MTKYKPLPPTDVIRGAFDYSPETGDLVWKLRRVRRGNERADNVFNAQFAGKKTGCDNGCGYLRVFWNRKHYVAHRLIWKLVHGTDATTIDHINGDGLDNRLANLRECNRSQNNANVPARAASGFKGAYRNGRGWDAIIRKNKERIHLGTFTTAKDAHAAYCEAAVRLHGKFARTSS